MRAGLKPAPTEQIARHAADDGIAFARMRWEAMMESGVAVNGRVTIPKAVRKHLGLKPGDRVKFFVRPDGSVVLLPKVPASALRGILKSWRRKLS